MTIKDTLESIQSAMREFDDEQLGRIPQVALNRLCEAIDRGDLDKAGRFALWRKAAMDEADHRGVAIHV